ncbi:hypothetical protein MKX03_022255 [Papaver bracteatum]|nr:hypothetical protein MKX03_022255 [Papaver bracteatum]
METPKLIKSSGSSLFLSTSVQELAKQSLAEVPARYIRTDQEPLSIVSGNSQSVPLELDKLHAACKEWGFFQVFDTLLVEKMKSEIQGFFNLSLDEKQKFWKKEGDAEGFGQNFIQSEDQKLDWGDTFGMVTLPIHMRNPRLFPNLPLPLRETIESYSFELSKLNTTLIDLMEKALKMETRAMAELFEDGGQGMRMNYYPPCPQPEHVIGLTPHSDAGGLTILLQLNDVDGLQIRKDNIWLPIKPLPNAFVVNIGDTLETPKLVKPGGSSLFLSTSVQELAKQSLPEVPARYLRTDQEPLSNVSGNSQSVPVIDLQKLLSLEPIIGELELDKLHSACKEWGFFQVVNHGVDTLLVEKMKSEIQGFFNLSMDEKQKFWKKEGDAEGFGQNFIQSEDQKLDWGDTFGMVTLPIHMRNPRLFPNLPLPLRETIESYSLDMRKLALALIGLMEKALKMETSAMSELFEDGGQAMRMNYYPPCPQPEHVMGLTPHSDAGGLTILLQLNDVDGLQIRKEKIWLPIKPLPNAFVVNIGDIFEIMSNGIYRSVEHRATINSSKERLSVAAFHSPKGDTLIGPMVSMITPETPALFRTIGYEEYMKKFFSRKLDGKSLLNSMRIGKCD